MIVPEFVNLLRTQDAVPPSFRLGVIDSGYVSGRPTVRFYGETTTSSKTYPYAGSYTPAADDVVLVAVVGSGGVILCKVV